MFYQEMPKDLLLALDDGSNPFREVAIPQTTTKFAVIVDIKTNKPDQNFIVVYNQEPSGLDIRYVNKYIGPETGPVTELIRPLWFS